MNREELSDIFELFIDTEATKPDTDINGALFDDCAEFTLKLDKNEMQQFSEYSEKTWRTIQNRLLQERLANTSWHRPVIWVAACLLLFPGVGAMEHFVWIQTEQIQKIRYIGFKDTKSCKEKKLSLKKQTSLSCPDGASKTDFSSTSKDYSDYMIKGKTYRLIVTP